jgi:RNA binding exosome subunit
MATFTKNKNPFIRMEIVSESRGYFGRKVGILLSRLEQDEQLSIHRHAVQE